MLEPELQQNVAKVHAIRVQGIGLEPSLLSSTSSKLSVHARSTQQCAVVYQLLPSG